MRKGFDSEVFDSQTVFRHMLTAMAYPGTIAGIGIDLFCPDRLHGAAGALLLTLLDFETPLWADMDENAPEIQWLQFHTGAPFTREEKKAKFALFTDCRTVLEPAPFNPGTVASPDISATLIIQTKGIDNDRQLRLTGPGIERDVFLQLRGITPDFIKNRMVLNQAYPAGIDMFFVHADQFVALPRTTKMELC
jgi:alpha-D-ribose 1-methylphosphonate 5-triphosphate synthase subunit PhnH